MTFPFIFRKEIKDPFAQENFKRLFDQFTADPYTQGGFKFFEFAVPSAVTAMAFAHDLGFQPKDVVLLHDLNNTITTFDFGLFTAANVFITTSGATTVRALIGRI